MGLLAIPFLLVLHLIYSLVIIGRSFRQLIIGNKPPLALRAPRSKTPKHLSILFVPDSEIDIRTAEQCMLDSIENAIEWCQQLGIEQLSVYDEDGILSRISPIIQKYFESESAPSMKEKASKLVDMVYPITPPASRPLSPEPGPPSSVVKLKIHASPYTKRSRRNKSATTTLNIVSKESSKINIATIADTLAVREYLDSKDDSASCKLTISSLESMVEGEGGLPATDFMIVHPLNPSKYNRAPMELHGFPPWQTRLTEIYHNRSRRYYRARLIGFLPVHIKSSLLASHLSEEEFRSALDHFSGVEMRLGK